MKWSLSDCNEVISDVNDGNEVMCDVNDCNEVNFDVNDCMSDPSRVTAFKSSLT